MLTMEQKKMALEAIAQANGGVLTPNAVVEAAKNRKHILNELFPWDDQEAAHRYRLDIARNLIRSVEVIVEFEDVTVSAVSFVHDVRQGRKGQGYVSVEGLSRRREDARQTVLIELERIIGAVERGRGIAASLGLADYFEQLLKVAMAAKLKVQLQGKGGKAA